MQAERDMLRDFVLPKVNEFASQYGYAIEFIDLRWGVDTASISEEEQNRKILYTCLDEIKRSRPFFIGLIGDRYGWIPPHQDMEAVLKASQFSLESLSISVTALEIEFGVLSSDSLPICQFYFRKSPDYTIMQKEFICIYQDSTENLDKLEKLKKKIYSRFGAYIKDYTAEVHENGLTVSKDWADMVAIDLIEKLRQEWGEPSDTPLSWKESEQKIQESFRESHTAYFTGRATDIANITAFCLGDNQVSQLLMIQGEAGSGKSGLLCKVMDEIEDKCLLLSFCCGISSRSSLVEDMLRYFITMLCGKLAKEDDSDTIMKFQDLKARFIELLFIACEKMRVVAVVDALDQFASSDETHRMLWISGQLPANFRLLCSIINGSETDAIKRLDGAIHSVPLISKKDGVAIIHSIAARHHKQIGDAVVEHILKKETPKGIQAAQNPLYLSLITQDLVMMDRYGHNKVQKYMNGGISHPEALAKVMQQRIDETPCDPENAYLAILSRLGKLVGNDFVREVCDMIAVSRRGLRESDLEAAFKNLKKEFNSADFSWLRQMLREHFSQGDMQQWDFSHQSLRRALRKDRLEELKKLNYGLVVHFSNIVKQDYFVAREIMHHLCVANRPDLVAEVIAICEDTHYNVLARGLADAYIENEGGDTFLQAIPAGTKNVIETELWRVTEVIRNCLSFLPEKTRLFRIELIKKALFILQGQNDVATRRTIAYAEVDIADLYKKIGQTKKAEKYYQKSIKEREDLFKKLGTDKALWELAKSYNKMNDYITYIGQKKAKLYNKKSLNVYKTLADNALSEKRYAQYGSTVESLLGLFSKLIDYIPDFDFTENEDDLELFREFIDLMEALYKQFHVVDFLKNMPPIYGIMGDLLTKFGHTEKAEEYYQKSLDAAEVLYEQCGTTEALKILSDSNLSMEKCKRTLGNMEIAWEYYKKALYMAKTLHEQIDTAETLKFLLILYDNIDDYHKTLKHTEKIGEYYQKSLEANKTLYEQRGTLNALRKLSISYTNIGDYMMMLDHTKKAGEYYQKSLEADKMLYEQRGTLNALRDLSVSYSNMGNYMTKLGYTKEAGEYYQKSLEVDKKLYVLDGTVDTLRNLIISYDNIGDNKHTLGLYDEANNYRLKALKLFEQSVKLDPTGQEYDSYYRDKVINSKTKDSNNE